LFLIKKKSNVNTKTAIKGFCKNWAKVIYQQQIIIQQKEANELTAYDVG
jgi:hypothetical protein